MKDATQSSCQVNGSLLLQECLLSQTEHDRFCRWSEASFKLELSLTFEIFNCQHMRNSWLSLHFLLDRGSQINFKYMPWISCLLEVRAASDLLAVTVLLYTQIQRCSLHLRSEKSTQNSESLKIDCGCQKYQTAPVFLSYCSCIFIRLLLRFPQSARISRDAAPTRLQR